MREEARKELINDLILLRNEPDDDERFRLVIVYLLQCINDNDVAEAARSITKPPKPYILLQYRQYYPYGGLNDYAGSFDTIEEARKAVGQSVRYQIAHRDEWRIIEEGGDYA